MNQIDPEVRRRRIETLVKVGGLGFAGFLVAPFIFLAIKGIIGLAIAIGMGSGIIFYTPVLARKAANWRLKMLKAEAMRNPIETLQNEYNTRDAALKTAEVRIKSAIASRNTFGSKLEGFAEKFPNKADKYKGELADMDNAINQAKLKYKTAQQRLSEFEAVIEQANAEWELAQAAQAAGKAIGMTNGDFMSKLMETTALDSVRQSLSMAFADLDTSSLTFEVPPKEIAEATPDLASNIIVDAIPAHARKR